MSAAAASVTVFRIRRAKPGPLHIERYKDDRITKALCSLMVLVGEVQRVQVDASVLSRYRVCISCARRLESEQSARELPEVHEVQGK